MRVILCNCPPDAAETLARTVVEAGLAACVNLVPGVKSIYRWQGDVVEDGETTLVIKAAAADVPALRKALVDRHPYEVPEFVVLEVDVEASHAPYVEWVRAARS